MLRPGDSAPPHRDESEIHKTSSIERHVLAAAEKWLEACGEFTLSRAVVGKKASSAQCAASAIVAMPSVVRSERPAAGAPRVSLGVAGLGAAGLAAGMLAA